MSQLLKRKCAGLFLGINPKGLNPVRFYTRKDKGVNKLRGLYDKKIAAGLSRGQDEKSLGSITFCKFYANSIV